MKDCSIQYSWRIFQTLVPMVVSNTKGYPHINNERTSASQHFRECNKIISFMMCQFLARILLVNKQIYIRFKSFMPVFFPLSDVYVCLPDRTIVGNGSWNVHFHANYSPIWTNSILSRWNINSFFVRRYSIPQFRWPDLIDNSDFVIILIINTLKYASECLFFHFVCFLKTRRNYFDSFFTLLIWCSNSIVKKSRIRNLSFINFCR